MKYIKDYLTDSKKLSLINGISCIGKSYFIEKYNLIPVARLSNHPGGRDGKFFHGMLCMGRKATDELPEPWSKLYDFKAIVLGVPYYVWLERVEKDLKGGRKPRRILGLEKTYKLNKNASDPINSFKAGTEKLISKLDDYDIPYFLVDSRNNYPILDKSSFLAMLTEE